MTSRGAKREREILQETDWQNYFVFLREGKEEEEDGEEEDEEEEEEEEEEDGE